MNKPKPPKNRSEFKDEFVNFIRKEGAIIASEFSRYMESAKLLYYRATTFVIREYGLLNKEVKEIPTGDRSNPVVRELLSLKKTEPALKELYPEKLRIFYDSSIPQEKILKDTELLDKIRAGQKLAKARPQMGSCFEDIICEFFEDKVEITPRYKPPGITKVGLYDIDGYIPTGSITIKEKPDEYQIMGLNHSAKLEAPINVECKNQFDAVRPEAYGRFITRVELVKSKSLLSITTTINLDTVGPSLIGICNGLGINVLSFTPFPTSLYRYEGYSDKFIPSRILAGQLYYSEEYFNQNRDEIISLKKDLRALKGEKGKTQFFEFLGKYFT